MKYTFLAYEDGLYEEKIAVLNNIESSATTELQFKVVGYENCTKCTTVKLDT